MSEIYKLNDHDITCGMLNPLTNQLKAYENNQFKNNFKFLANLNKSFIDVNHFLIETKLLKQGILFYNAYDGLQGLNNRNAYKILSNNDTFHYLDFNIAKQLTRTESDSTQCVYCETLIYLNLYDYKPTTRTAEHRKKLKNLSYQTFKDLIIKIDFLVGIISAKPITPMKQFFLNNENFYN